MAGRVMVESGDLRVAGTVGDDVTILWPLGYRA